VPSLSVVFWAGRRRYVDSVPQDVPHPSVRHKDQLLLLEGVRGHRELTVLARLDQVYVEPAPHLCANAIRAPLRSLCAVGRPLAGFKNEEDRKSDQSSKFQDWFQDNFRDYLQDETGADGVRWLRACVVVCAQLGYTHTHEVAHARATCQMDVLYFASALLESEFQIIILVDMSLAFASFLFVFLYVDIIEWCHPPHNLCRVCIVSMRRYLWFQTRSLCIAIAGLAEIVLSMPVAYTLYRSLFQFKYFSGLNAMVIYVRWPPTSHVILVHSWPAHDACVCAQIVFAIGALCCRVWHAVW